MICYPVLSVNQPRSRILIWPLILFVLVFFALAVSSNSWADLPPKQKQTIIDSGFKAGDQDQQIKELEKQGNKENQIKRLRERINDKSNAARDPVFGGGEEGGKLFDTAQEARNNQNKLKELKAQLANDPNSRRLKKKIKGVEFQLDEAKKVLGKLPEPGTTSATGGSGTGGGEGTSVSSPPSTENISQSPGVWVTGANGVSDDQPLYKGGFGFLHMVGSAKTHVVRDGNTTKGEDIDISQSALTVRGRFYLEPLGKRFGMGNWGNARNLSNLRNIRNFIFGVSNCYVGLQLKIGISGGDEGLKTNEHDPDMGEVDTFLKRKYDRGATVMFGCQVAKSEKYGVLNAQAGVAFTKRNVSFSTAENQGGGNFFRTARDQNTSAPVFGLEYSKYWDYGNTVLGPSMYGGLNIGLHTEYVPGYAFREMTIPFDINYVAQIDAAWVTVFSFVYMWYW